MKIAGAVFAGLVVSATLAPDVRAEVVCSPDPLAVVGCKHAGKTKLKIHDDPTLPGAAKDTLGWSWLKGEAIAPPGAGNPAGGGTEYALCIYDGDDGVHTLVKDLQIPTGAFWASENTGFKYEDRTAMQDGVLTVRIKVDSVAPGVSLVKLKAKGIYLDPPGPPPDMPLQYFEQNPSVIIQLVNSVGTCWEAEYLLGDNDKVTGKDFKASTRN